MTPPTRDETIYRMAIAYYDDKAWLEASHEQRTEVLRRMGDVFNVLQAMAKQWSADAPDPAKPDGLEEKDFRHA